MADSVIYSTDFNAFTDGDLTGQDGWIAHPQFIVSDSAVIVSGAVSETRTTTAFRGNARPSNTASDSYVEFDMHVTSTTNNHASYAFLRVVDPTSTNTRYIRLQVSSFGRVQIAVRTTDGGSLVEKANIADTDPTRPVWVANTVKRVRFQVVDDDCAVYLDDVFILGAADVADIGFTGTASFLVNASALGGTNVIDNFEWGSIVSTPMHLLRTRCIPAFL